MDVRARVRLSSIWSVHALMLFSSMFTSVDASVTPSFPACYIASTIHETVDGNSKVCVHSGSSCSNNGLGYYFYCSEDHYCCTYEDCPACCVDENVLNDKEITGIVITSVLVVAFIILLTHCLVGKFCSKNPGS
ncbi:hypothetical protein ACF0H5_015173 [Mactra antiquata]